MCPNCEVFCPYWKLKESCTLSYVAYITDNSCTIAFSVMMSLWGKDSIMVQKYFIVTFFVIRSKEIPFLTKMISMITNEAVSIPLATIDTGNNQN